MEPSAEAIRTQVERLTDTALAGSPRLSRFLRFVVEQTLAGQQRRLKEYVVAVEVFDRPSDFDPRTDSIVRVEAGRLRAKLRDHYSRFDDVLLVDLERGGYVPTFGLRSNAAAAQESMAPGMEPSMQEAGAAPSTQHRLRLISTACVMLAVIGGVGFWWSRPSMSQKTVVAVLPFRGTTTGLDAPFVDSLGSGVARELVRDGRLAVVPSLNTVRFAGTRRSARDIAAELGAQLLITGQVESQENRVLVHVLLIDAMQDRKVWVEDFVASRPDIDGLAAEIAQAGARAAQMTRGATPR